MGNTIFRRRSFIINGYKFLVCWKDVKGIRMRKNPAAEYFDISVPPATTTEKINQWVEAQMEWVKKVEKAHQQHNPMPRPTREQFEDFKGYFLDMFRLREKEMGLSDRNLRLDFRWATSRWGSCAPQSGRVMFSLYLAAQPKEFTDYVIVHELSHIFHPDHSPSFWALVAKYCPSYQAIMQAQKSPLDNL